MTADYKEKVAKLSEEINALRDSKAVKGSVSYRSLVFIIRKQFLAISFSNSSFIFALTFCNVTAF